MTIYLTVQPALLAAISHKNCSEFFQHLPFVHLRKHWELQKEIAELQKNLSESDDPVYASILQDKETELQEFKIFTAMGESAPQVILALLIVIKEESLEDWTQILNPVKNPIVFL